MKVVEILKIQLAENQDWSPWPVAFGLIVGRDKQEPEEFVYVGLQSLDLRLHLQSFGGRLRLFDFRLTLLYIH